MSAVRWHLVVPVKPAAYAKSRLAPAFGRWRPALARAFAEDTIGVAARCERTYAVSVISDDHELADRLSALSKVTVVPDLGGGDLNAAITAGLAQLRSDAPVATVTADLPALTDAVLADALDRASAYARAVVADREGVGTTMLTARTRSELIPRFGMGSLQRHRHDGAIELDLDELSPLRRDVDLPAHLTEATRLGLGPATARVVADLHDGTGSDPDPVPSCI